MNERLEDLFTSGRDRDGVRVAEKYCVGHIVEYKRYLDLSCALTVYPDEKILFVLSNLGDDKHNIGDEWARRVKNMQHLDKLPYNTRKVFGAVESQISETVGWLTTEVGKLDSDQLTPSLKDKILSMLAGEE